MMLSYIRCIDTANALELTVAGIKHHLLTQHIIWWLRRKL